MVSTYLEYNLVTRDMKVTLQRTAAQQLVARDTAYYKENIGKVGTVDEFLDDYRLYSYAMKAHGLEDMTYAKAFMRKVLESDLSDESSYANRLSDERYRDFARAFSFSKSTEVVQSNAQEDAVIGLYNESVASLDSKMKVEANYFDAMTTRVTNVQQLLQNDRLREYTFAVFDLNPDNYNYQEVSGALSSDLADPNSYFNTVWQPVLDQSSTRGVELETLVGKHKERAAALGQIDANNTTIANNDAIKPLIQAKIDEYQAMISEPGANQTEIQALIDAHQAQITKIDADKPLLQAQINTLQTRVDALNTELPPLDQSEAPLKAIQAEYAAIMKGVPLAEKYKQLAAAFDFNADGTMTAGTPIVNDTVKSDLRELYFATAPRLTASGALINKAYYEAHIGDFTNPSDLLSDARMRSFIITAYGLPRGIAKLDLAEIMKSDLDDPLSYANTKGGADNVKYKEVAKAFNFLPDGTLPADETAQSAAQIKGTTDVYMSAYNDADDEADETLIKSYRTLIGLVSDIGDLFLDAKLLKVALTAFGLQDEADSPRKLRQVLLSDLNDPKSYANSLKDSRYTDFAKAFNFKPDGSIGSPTLAQTESEILNTAKSYVVEKSRFGTEDDKKKATAESSYYSAQIETVKSLDDFLSNRQLVDFVLVAQGIDPETVTTETMRQMFESDLDDPESLVNTQSDTKYRDIVASFNFNLKGQIEKPKEAQIQTRRGLFETEDLYLNQTLEETKGEDNAGVRLALYFRRKAEGVNNAYDLLADSALLQVIQTTFSIPQEMSSADVDLQYDYINRVLDIKDLHDPEKLEKLMARFAALYDVDNNTDVSAAALILGGGSGGISADTLLSLTQLRAGGF